MEHTILLGFVLGITGFLIYDVIWLKEDFCVYICPYSRVQSVLYDDDTYQAIYDSNRGGDIYNENKEKTIFKINELPEGKDCTACQACVNVCPTGIDIRKGMQLECINCLECVDACSSVMNKLGKPSLVQWGSTNQVVNKKETPFFRKKTIMYFVALLLIVGMLFVMGGKKEYMLLNINKTTSLYKIKEEGTKVTNNFLFLFQNTQREKYTYNIEIVGEYKDKIKIERFRPFTLSKGKLTKKVVILSTKEKLSENTTSTTPIKVMVRAYAEENPEKINVLRTVVFMFPRGDKINMK